MDASDDIGESTSKDGPEDDAEKVRTSLCTCVVGISK